MGSDKTPLQVVYLGPRQPVFPTESNFLQSNANTGRWMSAYVASLFTVYVTLKIWWELVPSYPIMFYLWMLLVPVGVAQWAVQNKKGCLSVGLMAGGAAWCCDFFLLAMIDGDN